MSRKTIALVSVLALVLILLCGGGGIALWYFKYGPGGAVADVGPMAGGALALPADTGFLAGLDVKGLFASAAYKQIASGELPSTGSETQSPEEAAKAKQQLRESVEKGLKEAEDKTGVRFDRDVQRIVLGGWNVSAEKPDGAVVAFGHFERDKVMRAIEATAKAEGATVTTKTVEGVNLLVFAQAGKPAALAVPDESTLIVGTEAGVTSVVTNRAKHARPFETNTTALPLVKALDPASSYWIVVDPTVMGRADKEAAGAVPVALPRSLTLAGKYDGGLELAGEMADDAAAKSAAEMLQGGLGMARMQAEQNPEVAKVPGAKAMLEGIQVKAVGKRVSISVPSSGGTGLSGVIAALALPSLLRARDAASAISSEAVAPPAETSATPEPAIAETPAAEPSPVAPKRIATPRPARPTPRPEPTARAVAPPPPAQPSGPVRVGGNVSEPRKTKNVTPKYPDIARTARVQGVVILECTINEQGRVSDVQVLRGAPLLAPAAVEAVKQWEYEPTRLNGVPVSVIMTVTVNFTLK